MSGKGALVFAAAMVAIMVVLHFDTAKAANYVVGTAESNYWNIIDDPHMYYPNGSTLNRSDTLQFIYNNKVHNVVGVGPTGYQNCSGTNGSTPYTTGNDTIKLTVRGCNYFICTKNTTSGNMCDAYGMKIAVNAD